MSDSVAIIGMAARFPGAPDVRTFWHNLIAGIESIVPTGARRPGAEDGAPVGSRFVPAYGVLDGVEQFDAAFFGINPREAALLDPQQRLFLELAWVALEDAGYCPERAPGAIGVHAGVAFSSYFQLNVLTSAEYRDRRGNDMWKIVQFNTNDYLATRVAHKLDLHGPAVVVQSACSTALVAIHQACQSLLNYECDLSLAGAASVLLPQDGYLHEPGHILSADGRCRAFDAAASGTVPGSGAGVITLRRLEDALADGDPIRAVIRGSAINNDGARKAGYTAPSPVGQAEVIRAAHAAAQLEPDTIAMIECHGTGTSLGDPIEVRGLEMVFGEAELPARACALGSVKSNIGHLDAAAGVAGLIKAAFAVEHGVIPASLHVARPHPDLQLERTPFYIADATHAWPRTDVPRRAGVSSFGIGGTNAHAVLEQPPATAAAATARGPFVLPLSARTPGALDAMSARLADHLAAHPDANLGDVAFTLHAGRRQFHHRRALVCADLADAIAGLRGERPARAVVQEEVRRARSVAFLCSGQGTQRPGMGHAAYTALPVVRAAVDRSLALLAPDVAARLRALVFDPPPADLAAAEAELARTELTQPALFVLEHALAAQWAAWGVTPTAMAGHSLGELVAATIAGVFRLEDALGVVVERGRLMQAMAPGAMLSVRLSEAELAPRLRADLDLAAVNGARECVVAGPEGAVAAFAAALAADHVEHQRLAVSHAFHSAMMEAAVAPLVARIAGMTLSPPSIPIVSTLTGTWLRDDEATDPAYWGRQLRGTVRFGAAVDELLADRDRVLLEVGPGRALTALARRSPRWNAEHTAIASLDPVGKLSDGEQLPAAVARLWCAGVELDHVALHGEGRRRVSLPTYPFERKRYWIDAGAPAAAGPGAEALPAGRHGLAGTPLDVPGDELHQVMWIGPSHQAYLADHVVHGRVLVPATFYLSAILAMVAERLDRTEVSFLDVQMQRPLVVEDDVRMHVLLRPEGEAGRYRFVVSTCDPRDGLGRTWITHLEGALITSVRAPREGVDLAAARAECTNAIACDVLFENLAAHAVEFGPRWRWMKEAFVGPTASLVRLASPTPDEGPSAPVHPGLLDNGLGSGTIALTVRAGWGGDDPVLPYAIEAARFYRPLAGPGWCRGVPRSTDADGDVQSFDLTFWDDDGELVAEIDGFTLRRAPRAAFLRMLDGSGARPFHRVAWQRVTAPADAAVLSGRWLVLADDAARGARLAAALEAAGARATCEPAALSEVDGVLCWWEGAGESPVDAAHRMTASALHLTQALARRANPPRLAWAVPTGDVASAAVIALGRVVQAEYPAWRLRLIEIGAAIAPSALARELAIADDETEVRLVEDDRQAARLVAADVTTAEQADPSAAHGAVIVTGGLGGLGLEVARWLVAARKTAHLILVGRRPPTPGAIAILDGLRARGVAIEVVAADVADRNALAAALAARPAGVPLTGVIHAAGVLDDGVLADLTADRLSSVLRPKVDGAWHLHELTAGEPLRFFVLFSSVSATFGTAGQGNYAAANGFLDGLAAYRRALGLPATSIAWSPWSQVGMAAALAERERARLSRLGMDWIAPARGVAMLEAAIVRDEATLVAVQLDGARLVRGLAGGPVPPLLRALAGGVAAGAGDSQLVARLQAVAPAERRKLLVDRLRKEVARVIGIADVPANQPLQELGLDSLTALELRNGLAAQVGRTLPATLLFDYPTLDALAGYLLEQVLALGDETTPATASAIDARRALAPDEPIAIIGLGCRYPGGVRDPESFWDVLRGGVDAISEVPAERWDIDAYYDPDPDAVGKITTRSGGFLDAGTLDRFDPGFFGISPREAQVVDPQLRLLLETSWEALERAGVRPESLAGSRTGVYVGICGSEYQAATMADDLAINAYTMLGTACSTMVGRLSYVLGLKGPNFPIDTACSSSLVALHTACTALRVGDCDLALVGGVNTMLSPKTTIYFSRLKALSPSGRCKTFSADADGYARAEGCGMVVVKRLSDALADGDPVWAVIRGSAVNSDGRSQGLTAPNGPSQEAVIRQALAGAGLSPADIDFVECHGTGTPLGDPIEVQALGHVFADRPADRPLLLGSVKTNIGHTEGAAGVAGLIKAVLALRHGELPASLHARTLSPHIPWDELAVDVCREHRRLPANGRPRRAGVSSFGFSGTNAHVVLEEPPQAAATEVANAPAPTTHLLPVSARRADRLAEQARRLAAFLQAHPEHSLGEIAHALATERTHFAHRAVVSAVDHAGAIAGLRQLAAGSDSDGATVVRGEAGTRVPSVAFLFTGQGSQYAGMAAELDATEPVFRAVIDRCAAVLDRERDVPLRAVLTGAGEGAGLLDQTAYTQPALFALEVALAELWRSWGVEPAIVTGHSVGEYAAACVAGVFSIEDGLRLIAARGRLMQGLAERGAMISIAASEAEVAAAVAPHVRRVSIAAVNGVDQIVIAGGEAEVLAIAESFTARGVRTRRLTVSHAFHSPLMEPMLEAFAQVARSTRFASPRLPLVGNLDGRVAGDAIASADYWIRHVREPVRFADGVATLVAAQVELAVELGPQPTLSALAAAAAPDAPVAWLPSLRRDHDAVATTRAAAARLHVAGVDLTWEKLTGGARHRGRGRIALPTYAFARDRYWFSGASLLAQAQAPAPQPRVGADDALWGLFAQGRLAEALRVRDGLSASAGAHLDEILRALAGYRDELRARDEITSHLYGRHLRAVAVDRGAPLDAAGRWIVVAGDEPVGPALAAALTTAGGDVSVVHDVAALAAALAAGPTRGVVATWTLATGPDERDATAVVARALATVQTVIAAPGDARVWLVTADAVAISATDRTIDPIQTAIWGMGRVASLEHAERWGGLVDLPSGAPSPSLVAELVRAVSDGGLDDQLALRGTGARHAARLAGWQPTQSAAPWSTSGTALVTGGLGALGRALATWVVERGATHVVLTSRRGDEDPAATDIVAALAQRGATVTIARADADDRDAMAGVLAAIDATGSPLRSVFHAAGVVADQAPFREAAPADLARAFVGKVRGAEVLDELLGERALDAFVLCSSIASVWGAGRQASYAAANAYLDGVGRRRRAAGRTATVINWGPWAGAGMAAASDTAASLARLGLRPLPGDHMLRGLEHALAAGVDHLVIAAVEWERFRALYESERPRPLLVELPGAPADETPALGATRVLLDELRGYDPETRRAQLERWVQAAVAHVLGMPDPRALSPRTGFFDLGLDSLMSLELRKRVQGELGLKLSATVAFNHPNVEALALHLLDALGLADPEPDPVPAAAPVVPILDESALDALDDEALARLIDDEFEAVSK